MRPDRAPKEPNTTEAPDADPKAWRETNRAGLAEWREWHGRHGLPIKPIWMR